MGVCTMVQMLIVKDDVPRIYQAYLNGFLGAQRGHDDCLYEYDDIHIRCAIGCLLNEQTMEIIREQGFNSGNGMYTLNKEGVIDADYLEPFANIQEAHDSWASCSDYYDPMNKTFPKHDLECRFVALLEK